MRDNLNVDEREQLRKYEQKEKKGMLDNLSNENEKRTKIEKTKSNNLDNNEKEHQGKYEKKRRKLCVITWAIMKKNRLGNMTKKERQTKAYKLQMKETAYLIISKCIAWLIYPLSQQQLLD